MSTELHVHGRIGQSVKRVEDARFIRGKGNYLDDMELPNMLHMAILRSPHAHARIRSIDTAAAGAMPGVIAVVTGELMAQHKLAWMPTLSGDTQAVLATDKVRFQGQEVAAVIAETKYQAEDARDAIVVEYDVLQAVTSPQQSMEAAPSSSAMTRKARRTTTSTTGSRATRRPRRRPSPRPTRWFGSIPSIRVATPRR